MIRRHKITEYEWPRRLAALFCRLNATSKRESAPRHLAILLSRNSYGKEK